jgi:phosphotriesterase-related protein
MSDTIPVRELYSVTGPLSPEAAGIVDGHTHVWIDALGEVNPEAPILNTTTEITRGLHTYREAGGGTLIDCQPGGCGRNGNRLLQLSKTSGVAIVAATGFHLWRYYPLDTAFFHASVTAACRHFVNELTQSLEETQPSTERVLAGFIKIACEATLDRTPRHLVEAAVMAARETDAAIEVHTEKGADAELIAKFMLDAGLSPHKLILCHMDKRPDFPLHCSLAQAGIGLEYDTFFRPKYRPDEGVWPLLERMLDAGLEDAIVIATDMADAAMWRQNETGMGPAGLITKIIPRMEARGFASHTIRKLTGLNITDRLARGVKEPLI